MGAKSIEEVLEKFCEGTKEQPDLHLRRLADFLGCPFSPKEEEENMVKAILEMCSFDILSNLKVNREGMTPSGINYNVFFRNGKVGDWKNYLTIEMVKRLDKICEETLGVSFCVLLVVQIHACVTLDDKSMLCDLRCYKSMSNLFNMISM
ncbi:putative flavonol 3-sulfotransferase [Helianthus annuus]|uniref:Sulfotransferase n=2 Tax=Helianthus annuus TaxID=4232 RepID=A0A9K3H1N7_HELAN|nr:putative flavonol 3-sulfotransferase [Helianthus annuus]KAJ0450741.1 putative flavonol 3-sulfotransferase [Helianthus annuus]KAJ0455001.1 putative flavonol 3-sulfotransferase [Helianthus annuus]KAJ0472593.1 putative flavonol 3-sulfotransferase [Helianthus annuus]KAJ0648198.1 putative flavonol 3-sulfotransferase [Helianthus annuus]